MKLDSIDSLMDWGIESGIDFQWWKTSRTVDHQLVLALPPHESHYFVEILPAGGNWTVRHGDSADPTSLMVHEIRGAREPAELLENLCRSLIADAASMLDRYPERASALSECVLDLAEPLNFRYLAVAGVEMRARAAETEERTAGPEATRPNPEPRESAPVQAGRLPPQAPLRNPYFHQSSKAPRGNAVHSSPGSRQAGRGTGLAITSLVSAIVGYLFLYTWFSVILALVAIGTSFAVLVRDRQGRLLAWVGLVLGCACLLVAVALLLGVSRPGGAH